MKPAEQIVVIMTDTQRFDRLGCQGVPGMSTPQLDRLAAGGVRFDRAYTCQPVCGPARAALFAAEFTFGHRCASRAIDFLDRHGSERFCLVLSFDEPHDPFLCPRPFSQMYKGVLRS